MKKSPPTKQGAVHQIQGAYVKVADDLESTKGDSVTASRGNGKVVRKEIHIHIWNNIIYITYVNEKFIKYVLILSFFPTVDIR